MANRHPSHYLDIGVLGEELVAQWLQSTGWVILHRRWRCRWGEIDIIAKPRGKGQRSRGQLEESSLLPTPSLLPLVFVESRLAVPRYWDVGGLLSITQQSKQNFGKLLGAFGNLLADHTCRFDVARVLSKAIKRQQETSAKIEVPLEASAVSSSLTVQLGQSEAVIPVALARYIPSAFD